MNGFIPHQTRLKRFQTLFFLAGACLAFIVPATGRSGEISVTATAVTPAALATSNVNVSANGLSITKIGDERLAPKLKFTADPIIPIGSVQIQASDTLPEYYSPKIVANILFSDQNQNIDYHLFISNSGDTPSSTVNLISEVHQANLTSSNGSTTRTKDLFRFQSRLADCYRKRVLINDKVKDFHIISAYLLVFTTTELFRLRYVEPDEISIQAANWLKSISEDPKNVKLFGPQTATVEDVGKLHTLINAHRNVTYARAVGEIDKTVRVAKGAGRTTVCLRARQLWDTLRSMTSDHYAEATAQWGVDIRLTTTVATCLAAGSIADPELAGTVSSKLEELIPMHKDSERRNAEAALADLKALKIG